MFTYGQLSTTVITEEEAKLIQAESSLACLMDHGRYLFVVNASDYMLLNPEKAIESKYVAVTEIRNIEEQKHYVCFLDRGEVLPSATDSPGYYGCSDLAYEHVKALIDEKDPDFGIYDIAAKEVELIYDENGKCLNFEEWDEAPCMGLFVVCHADGNRYINFGVNLFRIADCKYISPGKSEVNLPVLSKTISEEKTLPSFIDYNKRRLMSDVVDESGEIRCTSNGLSVNYKLEDARDVTHTFGLGDMVEAEIKLMDVTGGFSYVWVFCHLAQKGNKYILQGYEHYPIENINVRLRRCDVYRKRLTVNNACLYLRDVFFAIKRPWRMLIEDYKYRRRLKKILNRKF